MRIINIKVATEGELNTAWLNRVLTLIFRLDVETAARFRPPVGFLLWSSRPEIEQVSWDRRYKAFRGRPRSTWIGRRDRVYGTIASMHPILLR